MSVYEQRIKTEDGREWIDMPTTDKNPCLKCGACCQHFRISFYHGELDVMPYGFVPEAMTEKVNERFACMKGTSMGGRCIAMEGEVGASIHCSIYQNRPSPCREYEVWDEAGQPNPKCQSLRQKHGIVLLVPQVRA